MYSVDNLTGSALEIIVQASASSTSGIFNVKSILVLKSSDPFAKIEAESYTDKYGCTIQACKDTGGGSQMASITNGYWLKYSNINLSEIDSISTRVSHKNSDLGTIEVRLGSSTGTLIGTMSVPNTGSWDKFQTVGAKLTRVVGFYDVYLVFVHPTSYVCNINWLQFFKALTTDVENVSSEKNWKIYPNPVGDYLTIENLVNSKVEIYNAAGQLMLQDVAKSYRYSISTQGLNKGMYIIKITNNGITKTSKLTKQ